MGVRDTPKRSTMANSVMRAPATNSPAKIISRNFNCTLTACEPPSSGSSEFKAVGACAVRMPEIVYIELSIFPEKREI
jgi:hypothetical protein